MRRPGWSRETLRQSISDVVCPGSFQVDQNHDLVLDQVLHVVPASVNVLSKLSVYLAVGYLNAGRVVFPDSRLGQLLAAKSSKHGSEVDNLLACH
eukprot:1519306-Rhodomonas_salina.2